MNKSAYIRYWPVATIYILSVTFAILWATIYQHASLYHLLQGFMASFFFLFALLKFRDISGFATRFASYDLIAKRVKAYGFAYPFIELSLAFIYLFASYQIHDYADIFVLVLSVIGLISVYKSILKKERLYCACLGTTFNLPLSYVAIFENSTMFFMAILMIAIGH